MRDVATWVTTDSEKASRLVIREHRKVLDGQAVCVLTWTEPDDLNAGMLFYIRTFQTNAALHTAIADRPEGVFS